MTDCEVSRSCKSALFTLPQLIASKHVVLLGSTGGVLMKLHSAPGARLRKTAQSCREWDSCWASGRKATRNSARTRLHDSERADLEIRFAAKLEGRVKTRRGAK